MTVDYIGFDVEKKTSASAPRALDGRTLNEGTIGPSPRGVVRRAVLQQAVVGI